MIVLAAFVWVLALAMLVAVLRDPKGAKEKLRLLVTDGEVFEPTREYPTLLPRTTGARKTAEEIDSSETNKVEEELKPLPPVEGVSRRSPGDQRP